MNPNYIYNKGDLLVAPGGGGAFAPLNAGLQNQVLTINNGLPSWQNSGGVGPQIINVESTNIDFTVMGPVLLYTPPVGYNFFFTNVFGYYTSVTAGVSDANFQLGVVSPNYYDYMIGSYVSLPVASATPALGIFSPINFNVSNENFATSIQFSTNSLPLYANISVAAVATTAIGSLVIQGVLIPQ